MTTGKFIVLEGLDGSGTTTQVARLATLLESWGHRVHTTHQPSARPLGRQIRELLRQRDPPVDPQLLALLFAADRLEHIAAEITPALERGEVVLCDRYVMSSWAYQSLSCDPDWVREINTHARWPDATFFLEVDPREATRRVHARTPEGEREIFETLAIQERVHANYQAGLASLSEQHGGVVTLDGAQPIDGVFDALTRELQTLGLAADQPSTSG